MSMRLQWQFNPLALRGRDGYNHNLRISEGNSIHSPCAGETNSGLLLAVGQQISIHSPCAGETCDWAKPAAGDRHFNPLALRGRDAAIDCIGFAPELFQSTRPARAKHAMGIARAGDKLISIHSPCAGETNGRKRWRSTATISIHSPCAGETANSSKNHL